MYNLSPDTIGVGIVYPSDAPELTSVCLMLFVQN